MTEWRTDLENVPKDGTYFDVFVRKTDGTGWRECDAFWSGGHVKIYCRDEPVKVEYEFAGGQARVTHWAPIVLPDS